MKLRAKEVNGRFFIERKESLLTDWNQIDVNGSPIFKDSLYCFTYKIPHPGFSSLLEAREFADKIKSKELPPPPPKYYYL